MTDPLLIGVIVFAVIMAGAFGGWTIGQCLPMHHLTDETKGVVTVSMGVVATISALVLGLLISNANTSFVERRNEITRLSADIIRLDHMLRRYGPDAAPIRDALRHYAERKANDLFPENPGDPVRIDDDSTYDLLFQIEERLLALRPADPRQQWLIGQAITLATNVGNTRWLLVQQEGQGVPKAFLALVTFWLTLLFASFGLFAPRNLTSAFALALCAIAVSGAVEMILEFEQPFTRLVRISPLPMRNAVHELSEERPAGGE
jgi:hypothetical protein